MPVQRFWEECSWSAFFPFFSFDWRNYARLIHSAEIPVSLSNFTGLKPRPHEQNCVLYWKCDKWIAKGQIIYHINCQRIWEVGWLLLKALTGLSGPTANPQKNEQCSPAAGMQIFRSESNIKKGTYLSRRESFLSSKETYLSSRDIYLSRRTKYCRKKETYFIMCTGPKALIALQQHSPLPKRCYPIENWLSSRSLTSVIVRELVFPSWDNMLWSQCKILPTSRPKNIPQLRRRNRGRGVEPRVLGPYAVVFSFILIAPFYLPRLSRFFKCPFPMLTLFATSLLLKKLHRKEASPEFDFFLHFPTLL